MQRIVIKSKQLDDFMINILRITRNGYQTVQKIGGARRDRTDDLLRARQALSQLSYGPFI